MCTAPSPSITVTLAANQASRNCPPASQMTMSPTIGGSGASSPPATAEGAAADDPTADDDNSTALRCAVRCGAAGVSLVFPRALRVGVRGGVVMAGSSAFTATAGAS